jgi:hypothetical protein
VEGIEDEIRRLEESKPSDFRLKHDSDGNLSKYRDPVIAKRFIQQFGIDCTETLFASVAKLASIRTTIALAISNDWELHCQMEIKSTTFSSCPEGRYPESNRITMVLLIARSFNRRPTVERNVQSRS